MNWMKQKEEREDLVLQVFKKIIIVFIVFFSLVVSVFANEKTAILNDVEKYLNNIEFLKANFLQDDITNSQLSEGVFYLSRPGKLRVDYLNPFEASLYVYNGTTTYYDKDLDEISNIRTASTPLQFLLRKKISFNDKDFSISNVKIEDDEIFVSFIQKNKEDEGTLILKFSKTPIVLKSIRLINGLDQEVEMTLFDISTNPVENSVFKFKNPRLKRKI